MKANAQDVSDCNCADWNPLDYFSINRYMDGTPILQGDVVVDPYAVSPSLKNGVVVRVWEVASKESASWSCPEGGILVSYDGGQIVVCPYADEHLKLVKRGEHPFYDKNTRLWVDVK